MGRLLNRRWLLTTILVIIGAAACVRLGLWQLNRLESRREFNTHVLQMRGLGTLLLPAEIPLISQEYREVVVRGTFDFENQVAIRNQAHDGQYGYHLLTPLMLRDRGFSGLEEPTGVLVDRGWIPAEGNDRPADWRKYDESGSVEIRGLVRLGQSSPAFGGMIQPTPPAGEMRSAFWMYVDVDAIGKQLPYSILPVYVQRDPAVDHVDPPLAAVPELVLTEGPHLGYAAQWFMFAAILVIGYPFYLVRKEAGRA